MSVPNIEKLFQYLHCVSKNPITFSGRFELDKEKYIPKIVCEDKITDIRLNSRFFLTDSCQMCGGCCPAESNVYTSSEYESIQKFTSDELELIINGRPFIDVDDWKNNTEYAEPYNKEHKIIKWFWEIVYTLDQKQLSNLLMFSTGTSRVPFGGFAALESNRGNLSKFKLERSEYNFMKKNFIKAHTCFNRLEVPEFDSKEEMEEAIKFISSNEIIGFGIE